MIDEKTGMLNFNVCTYMHMYIFRVFDQYFTLCLIGQLGPLKKHDNSGWRIFGN